MQKTTVYLSADTKTLLRETAQREGRSEAELIRESLELNLRLRNAPTPRLPLFRGAPQDLAEHAEDYLDGFGEQ